MDVLKGCPMDKTFSNGCYGSPAFLMDVAEEEEIKLWSVGKTE
jgi:hypothetical protein